MVEPKIEDEVLRVLEVKRENFRTTMEKLKSIGSDVLFFTLQWSDLEECENSVKKNLLERFRKLASKEKELESRSFAVEERAKSVEAAEALVGDLEMKANGFRDEIEEKKKELDVLKNQEEVCLVESKEVEMRLTQLRKSVEERTVEERLKASQVDEMVESLRKIQVKIDLKGEELIKMESDLERHCVEVSTEEEHLCRTQARRRELEEEIDRKMKDLSLVQDKTAECEKLLETQSSELAKIQGEVELKEKQLEQMNIDLERHRCEVSVEMERLDRSQIRSRELREEIETKGIALTTILDKTAECRKDQELVTEKLDSQQKLLDERSSELICKEKRLKELRLDIDLTEEAVKSLKGEMEEIERRIEEGTTRSESIKSLIEEHTEELASKERKQNEMAEVIRKLSLQIASEEKTLERAKAFTERLSRKHHEKENDLDSTRRHLEKCTAKYDSKKNELRSVKDSLSECLQDLDIKERELKSLESLFTERNEQVEEEEKRLQHLDKYNEELIRKITVKQEELSSVNKTIKECSSELEAKRNSLDQVQSSITNLTVELKSKECELDSVKNKIQDSLKDFQSKEEQQRKLEASWMKREEEFGLKEKELNAKEQELKSVEQVLAKCTKYTEQTAKKMSSLFQQNKTDQQVVLVREINACDEKHLQLLLRGHLKKCSEIQLDILGALKSSSDPAKLVLDTIQMMEQTNLDPLRKSSIYLLECLINMSPKPPNTEVLEQAIKLATEWKDTTLVKAVDAVDVLSFMYSLAAFCLAYGFDAENVQNLFDVTFLRKYVPSLCEALGVSAALVNNVLPLDDKPEQEPTEAPNKNSNDSRSQAVHGNVASSSHLADEDTLKDLDGSTSFSPNEVLTGLQYIKDPGCYVLNSVDDALMVARQRGELGLGEPILKTLIPLFEELPRVVRPSEHLQLEARKVAKQWSLMMRNTGQRSPLEAWGFLQLIVAYGLVDSTKQNATLQFASNVAHFRQAPKLFQSLGLSLAIPNFVQQLLIERKFILAIRFMFYFNLNSPMELLKEEIINLRRSVRRFESQVEERDAGKLRDIIELIEDFNLDIDLPGELILKFMVPRDALASPTVIPSSYISTTHGSNQSVRTIYGVSLNQPVIAAETHQGSESTLFQAQSSHQSGHKRPRVDPRVPSSSIRPCFNPSSSHGR